MMQKIMNPLFIPLKTEFFDAFASGEKTEELRAYGPRWNEQTCAIGRNVTLSKGYGKQNRLTGKIWKFKKQHATLFGSTYKAAIKSVFGTLDIEIACISIADLEPLTDIRMPERIQRRRTKGWRMPDNTIYVGRGSKWGNHFTVEQYGREKAIEKFRSYIGHPNSPHRFEPEEIEQLRGKNLACWCSLDHACHADVLLEIANNNQVQP